MDVSCITTQQIVYYPVDVPTSVSKSGKKLFSSLWSLAYASRLIHWALGRGVCIYTYPGGTPSISVLQAPSLPKARTCGVPGAGVTGSGGGTPSPLRIQWVCGFFPQPFRLGRQPSIWYARTIAGCLPIAAITILCQGKSATHIFSSRNSAWAFSTRSCLAYIAAHNYSPLAILAMFNRWHMSDCSSCTRPPCIPIVVDMWKT